MNMPLVGFCFDIIVFIETAIFAFWLPMGVAPEHVTRPVEDVLCSGSIFGTCSRQEEPCIIAVVMVVPVVYKADD